MGCPRIYTKMVDFQNRHFEEFNEKPQFSAQIPGVLTLFGFLAGPCADSAVLCTDSRKLYVNASVSERSQIQVLNVQTGDKKKISLNSYKIRKEDRFANYVKGTYCALSSYSKNLPALNISFGGPVGDCDETSVCTALSYATVLIVEKVVGLSLSTREKIKLVSQSCKFCGLNYDFARGLALIANRPGCFIHYDYRTQKATFIPSPFTSESQYRLVRIDSGVPYATVREELQDFLSNACRTIDFYRNRYRNRALSSLSDSEISERSLSLAEELKKLALFLKDQSACSLSAKKALLDGNIELLGRVLSRQGRLLRDEIDLSCPELDWIAKRLLEGSGCLGVSSVWSGNGAIALVVLKCPDLNDLESRFSDYGHIFGFDVHASEFAVTSEASLSIF